MKRFLILGAVLLSMMTDSQAQEWHITGNPATSTDFLGTTNATKLTIKVNNIERIKVLPKFGNRNREFARC